MNFREGNFPIKRMVVGFGCDPLSQKILRLKPEIVDIKNGSEKNGTSGKNSLFGESSNTPIDKC